MFEKLEEIFQAGKHFAVFGKSGHLPSPKHINLKTRSEAAQLSEDSNIIFIADMKKEGEFFHILIKRGNPDIALASFTNIETDKSRSPEPEDGETSGTSSHVTVSFGKAHKGKGGHRTTMEATPGLSRSLIIPYLNGLIWENVKDDPRYSYTETVGKGKNKKDELRSFRPTLTVFQKKNKSLAEDLAEGYLSSIEFVTTKVDDDDMPEGIASIRHGSNTFKWHLNPTKDTSLIDKIIGKARKYGESENHDFIRLKVKDSVDGKYKTSRITIQEGDAQDKLYARSITIDDFDKELNSCYDKIFSDFEQKASIIINDNVNWKT